MLKCKLCKNKILAKTARKYKGYSRQCLEKTKLKTKDLPQSISEAAVDADMDYWINKTKIQYQKMVYSKKEYDYIYATKYHPEYYQRYINKVQTKILEIRI